MLVTLSKLISWGEKCKAICVVLWNGGDFSCWTISKWIFMIVCFSKNAVWEGWELGWKSVGGAMQRALYGANKVLAKPWWWQQFISFYSGPVAELPRAPIPTLVPIRKGGGENAKVFNISWKLQGFLYYYKVFVIFW